MRDDVPSLFPPRAAHRSFLASWPYRPYRRLSCQSPPISSPPNRFDLTRKTGQLPSFLGCFAKPPSCDPGTSAISRDRAHALPILHLLDVCWRHAATDNPGQRPSAPLAQKPPHTFDLDHIRQATADISRFAPLPPQNDPCSHNPTGLITLPASSPCPRVPLLCPPRPPPSQFVPTEDQAPTVSLAARAALHRASRTDRSQLAVRNHEPQNRTLASALPSPAWCSSQGCRPR